MEYILREAGRVKGRKKGQKTRTLENCVDYEDKSRNSKGHFAKKEAGSSKFGKNVAIVVVGVCMGLAEPFRVEEWLLLYDYLLRAVGRRTMVRVPKAGVRISQRALPCMNTIGPAMNTYFQTKEKLGEKLRSFLSQIPSVGDFLLADNR